jgi:hypothetical protein
MRTMSTLACHDCGAPLEPGEELWQAPGDPAPDEDGEPYCLGCACPAGIAA